MLAKHIFVVLLVTFLLSACSYEYHIKDEGIVYKQRQLFNQLCEATDRSVIYKTVEVDGYLSASRSGGSCQDGWNSVLGGYQFAECTTSPVHGYQLPANADIYHFTIENDGHPGCGTGKQWYIKHSRESYHGSDPAYKETNRWMNYRKRNQDKLTGKCLVVQKVDRPESRYMFLSTLSYYDEHEKMFFDEFLRKYDAHEQSTKKGIIGVRAFFVFDMKTGQILSKDSNYSFFPKGRRGSSKSVQHCQEKKLIPYSDVLLKPYKK